MSYAHAPKLKPKGKSTMTPFPPGYTQKDEDNHQRILRNIRCCGVALKLVGVIFSLTVVYLFATAPPPVTTVTIEAPTHN